MTSKNLIKKLGLTINYDLPENKFAIKFPPEVDAQKFYGDKVKVGTSDYTTWCESVSFKVIYNYTNLTMPIFNRLNMRPYNINGKVKYYYNYPGKGWLLSTFLVPYDDLCKIYKLKIQELSDSKNKRLNKVENVIDVIRVTLMKNNIKFRRVAIGYSVYLGFIELRFNNRGDSTLVEICFAWDQGGSIGTEPISSIDIADPKFEEIIIGYVKHGKNIINDLVNKVEGHDHKTNTTGDGQDPQEDQD